MKLLPKFVMEIHPDRCMAYAKAVNTEALSRLNALAVNQAFHLNFYHNSKLIRHNINTFDKSIEANLEQIYSKCGMSASKTSSTPRFSELLNIAELDKAINKHF